jgi:hypothetical protein
LVLSFMRDAPAAVREMRRVVRPEGTLAACMWAAGEAMQMVHFFWTAVAAVDPGAPAEPAMTYRTEQELRTLWESSGLQNVQVSLLALGVTYQSFDDLWDSLLTAAGPVGAYTAKLDEKRRERLRDELRKRLGSPRSAFVLTARAWAVRGSN